MLVGVLAGNPKNKTVYNFDTIAVDGNQKCGLSVWKDWPGREDLNLRPKERLVEQVELNGKLVDPLADVPPINPR